MISKLAPKQRHSLRYLFMRNMTLVALASLVTWILLWIWGEYQEYQTEKMLIRQEYTATQKALIKDQVATAISYINHMRGQTEQRLRQSIKGRVNEAIQIATNLHLQYKDSKSATEIKKMIKEALRPIRFNDGRGYYFAFNKDGIEELFADRPELEGTNMLSVQGGQGEFVVRDMLDMAAKEGDGFYRYTWTKPGRGNELFPKIAYIKTFSPYDWIIGTGEYLDDVEKSIKSEVIQRLVELRFGKDGYFFGSTFSGGSLFSNGRITKGTGDIWNLTDPNGVKIIQEQFRMAQKPEGGFVFYAWNKLGSKNPSPKISYVRGIPEWQWIIGTGVYLDTVEGQLAARIKNLLNGFELHVIRSLVVLIILMILVVWWANRFSRSVSQNLATLSGFFQKAAADSKPIGTKSLYLREFGLIAEAANKMIQDRQEAVDGLRLSEEKYSKAFNTSPYAISITRLADGKFIEVNRSFSSITGYSRQEILSASSIGLGMWVDEDDRKEITTALLDKKSIVDRELRLKTKNGLEIKCLFSAQLIDIGDEVCILTSLNDITERLLAEEKLRQNERLLRTIADNYPNSYLSIIEEDLTVGFTAGQEFKKQNLAPDQFVGLSVEQVFGDQAPIILDHYRATFSGQERAFELSINDQHQFYKTVPLPASDGSIPRILSVVENITEQKQAQEDLAKEKQRLNYILEATNAGTWEWNVLTGEIVLNERWAEIVGYTMEELAPVSLDTLKRLTHPDDFQVSSKIMEQHLSGDLEYYQCETRLRHKNGGWVWVLDRGRVATRTDDGKPSLVAGTHQDINVRKQAEEAIKASETKFRRLFEMESDSIFLIDNASGQIIEANKSATECYGYSRQELLGKKNTDLSAEPDQTQQAVKNNLKQVPIRWHKRKDGTVFPVEIVATHFEWDNRSVHIAAIRDITLRKQAEDEREELQAHLQQAQKMEALGTLAGGIAHDFNNILAAILGYSELALEDAEAGDSNSDQIIEIIRAGKRAKDLVTQILGFSRKLEPDLKPLKLNRVVLETKKMLKRTIPRMINIEHDLAEDLWLINADSSQMTQILMNLGTNANDAMSDGGRLAIRTENVTLYEGNSETDAEALSGDYVLLTVSDTGQGMDKETLEQIFDPFFTDKEVGKGTGLGLAMVYGIVKNHNGQIKCHSEMDQGTTFQIYLPANRSVNKPVIADISTESNLHRGEETILVVDDEANIIEMGRQILRRQGYHVLYAESGEEALAIYQEKGSAINLIILDISMPGMGGHKCLQELLRINPHIKVVISSGYFKDGQLNDTLESGAAGYIPKPFSKAEMLRTVRQVLDEA